MFGHEAVAYECCRNSMEKFCREEDLPVKSIPALVSPDDEVLGDLQRITRALRRALTLHKSGVQQLHTAGEGTVAK